MLGGFVGGNIASAQITKVVDKDGTSTNKLMKYIPGGAVAGASIYGMGMVKSEQVKFLLAGSAISGGLSVVKQVSEHLKINIPGLGNVEEGSVAINTDTEKRYFRPNYATEMEYVEYENVPRVMNGVELPGFETISKFDSDEMPALPQGQEDQFQGVENPLEQIL